MRGLLLRVGAAIIGLTGVVVAIAWPASCYRALDLIYLTCERHVLLRVVIAGAALAVAVVVAALSYERARPRPRLWGVTVYDPFAGSGTVIVAAEQLGRRAYAMELEPGWCDVAVARWEELTGGKARRKR